jgi:hypothetical protein
MTQSRARQFEHEENDAGMPYGGLSIWSSCKIRVALRSGSHPFLGYTAFAYTYGGLKEKGETKKT